jgi:small subunit ribosomal protein S7
MRAFAKKKNKSRKNFHFQINYVCRKLINCMSSKGKKTVCERLFAKTLVHLSRESKAPLNYFIAAISNIVPFVEIKTLRQGNRITKIAVPLNEKRGLNIALQQLVKEARGKSGSFDKSLAEVLTECGQKRGQLIKNKENIEEDATNYKGLSHYRW